MTNVYDEEALRVLIGAVEDRLKPVMPRIHELGYVILMVKEDSEVRKVFDRERFKGIFGWLE